MVPDVAGHNNVPGDTRLSCNPSPFGRYGGRAKAVENILTIGPDGERIVYRGSDSMTVQIETSTTK
jgi:hypothetical protein